MRPNSPHYDYAPREQKSFRRERRAASSLPGTSVENRSAPLALRFHAALKRCRIRSEIEIKHVQRKDNMKTKTTLLAGLFLGAMVTLAPSVATASLIGSVHDFSSTGGSGGYATLGIATFKWGGETNTYENPCQVCHIPPKAAAYSAANAPLWNHAVATNATTRYATYDQAGSATFNALGLGPLSLGSSVACLSCHEGSFAVNQSYGKTSFNGNGGGGTETPREPKSGGEWEGGELRGGP